LQIFSLITNLIDSLKNVNIRKNKKNKKNIKKNLFLELAKEYNFATYLVRRRVNILLY